MEIGLRLNMEPEAARPAGSEMPHRSQGFINDFTAVKTS